MKRKLPLKKTTLEENYTVFSSYNTHDIIKFNNCAKSYVHTLQSKFMKYMKNKKNDKIHLAHGCKNPDECFIDEKNKTIFIIEKKFQQVSGSVCEKIQTPDFKVWQYGRMFPEYTIVYTYLLSDWFKTNCIAELEYLDFKNIKYWFCNGDYKINIVDYITNYK